MDKDDGPLGPYYSIGFTEVEGVFYATQQRNWNWGANRPFTGLVGMAYSTNLGRTWRFSNTPFPAPIGNLTFISTAGRGRSHPDGYVYAIGTEREFNASRMIIDGCAPASATSPVRARRSGPAESTRTDIRSGRR